MRSITTWAPNARVENKKAVRIAGLGVKVVFFWT